jgi:hypothetical protein
VKYAIELVSDGIIFLPSFINIGLDIQKLLMGYTETQEQGYLISLLLFIQN